MEGPKQAGDTFLDGKLEVLGVLGVGGMGTVYEVRHTLTKHRRALKVIRPEATNATIIKRFEREASVAGTLDSPYITEIYDAGQLEDGGFYVLMEMLEGETLRDYLGRVGSMEPGPACALVEEICRGLRVAHEAGIIHRDLKPENVFLVDGADGPRVKLIDFGISKFEDAEAITAGATKTGAILGTPLYMSPEQLKSSRDVDARTDLYAVGVMLYEILSGARPYQAESLPTLLVNIYMGERLLLRERVPSLPEELAAIVEKALHLEPDARFANIADLQEAIAPFASELRLVPRGASTAPIAFLPTAATDQAAIPATMNSVVTPPEATRRANRWPMMLLLVVVAAGVAWALTHPDVEVEPTQERVADPIPDERVLPRGEETPPVEIQHAEMQHAEMQHAEMQPEPTMDVRMVRPSERDGLMRPSYGMPR